MKLSLIAIICFLSIAGFSQEKASNWFTNLDEAKAWSAANNNADILMVFAGSDWCRPCIKFKNDILVNEKFLDATKTNLAILYLDFPSKKKNKLSKEETKQNESLAEKYNKSGAFPKIVLLASDKAQASSIQYNGENVADFLSSLNK